MNQTKYKICKLNEVAWFQEGPGVRKSQFRTSGVKLLNVGNICDRELVLDKTSIYISEEEAYGKYKHFLVDEGDLLIASSGIKVDYFDKKITFARKEHLPLCMNTSTIRFKVLDKTQLDIHYLRHFLASRYFTKQVQFYITGSAQLNFGPSHLNKMTIILPPLEEQKKIAKILDKADEIRAKKKLANDKLDEFLKSTFISMFGDPVNNTNNYPTQTISSFAKVKIGPFGSSLHKEEYIANGIPLVNPSQIIDEKIVFDSKISITEKKFAELQAYKLEENDIIIGRRGEIGRAAVVTTSEKCICGTGSLFVRIINPIIKPLILQKIISSNTMKEKLLNSSVGVTMNNLNAGIIENLEIAIPPIELQNKFSKIVEHIEAQKQKNELVIEQMNNLFNSLSQRAFKGEL